MISFYILSNRFFLYSEGLFDTRIASVTTKEHGFAVNLL